MSDYWAAAEKKYRALMRKLQTAVNLSAKVRSPAEIHALIDYLNEFCKHQEVIDLLGPLEAQNKVKPFAVAILQTVRKKRAFPLWCLEDTRLVERLIKIEKLENEGW